MSDKPLKNIDDVLKKLVGHKITLHYTQHTEGTLRETSGILKSFNEFIIWVEGCNEFGEWDIYYMNRHACVLLSITDYGVK